MAKKFRTVPSKDPISSCLLDGVNDLRELHDEMESWQEQMESASMEHLPKYDEVQAAVEVLEHVGEVEFAADAIKNLIDEGTIEDMDVAYVQLLPYGKRPAPRWMRHTTAINQLGAVADVLQENENDEVRSVAEELNNQVEEVGDVEFPSMY